MVTGATPSGVCSGTEMQLRTPFQRLARRLHIAGGSPEPLPGPEIEMAVYLNALVSLAGGGALLVLGVALPVSAGAVVFALCVLTVALYHRHARWVSIALGSAFAIGAGVGLGRLADQTLYVVIGGAFGALCAAIAYGRFVRALFRRTGPPGGA
jgi:hypothetical protein